MTRLSPQERALLPLRAFLGFTFCFAGLQKLANHGFFDASDPASIQAQLAASARRSPIHALITPLEHVSIAVGLLIALGELAIGVGTLLGLWSRLAALGGIVLALMLFLTVSFHSSPYYTGADIVFAFAWTPLLLTGPTAWSLDAVLAERAAQAEADRARAAAEHAKAAASRAVRRGKAPAPAAPAGDTRRETLLKGTVTAAVAVGTLIVGGLTALFGRLASNGTKTAGAVPTLGGTATSPAATSPAASSSATSIAGRKSIGPATSIPVGSAAAFTDPASSDPAIVLHPTQGTFLAFDAVCPHAGCTVQYDPTQAILVCPCHGSQFNATTGAVEVGPAATGLRPITVTRGPGDDLYAS